VLFLSDGFQTAGLLQPLEGAARAKELGIPVYTIALGTQDGVIELDFGGFQRQIPVPPDRDTLRAVAQETGGKFYDAPTAEALKAAYGDLESLLSKEPGKTEGTAIFVGISAALLLLAGALSAGWGGRTP
jgi:Ca-activated chloride channel family protein